MFEELSPRSVRGDIGIGLGRIQRPLRQQRPRNGGDRQQEQQHQGGAHADQSPPASAHQARGRGDRGWRHSPDPTPVLPPNSSRNQSAKWSHGAGQEQQAHDDQQAATDPADRQPMASDEAERTTHPAEAERHQDERHPEPQAITRHEKRAPTGRSGGVRHRIDHRQRRRQTRSPGQPERRTQQRRAQQSGGWPTVDAGLALQRRDEPHESEAEHDRHRAEDPLDGLFVIADRGAEAAEQDALGDEDDTETDHEQQRAQHHPPFDPGAGAAGQSDTADPAGAPPTRSTRPRIGRFSSGQTGDIGQVPGYQRQDARRQEAEYADQHRHSGGHDQRSVGYGIGEGGRGNEHRDRCYCSAASEVNTGVRSAGVSACR